jgi:transcriptional accessory protein Tex/SPT6
LAKKKARAERYDEDGLDDFIEDDIGDQDEIHSGMRGRAAYDDDVMMEGGVSEAQLNEASDIFGTDYLDFMDGTQREDGYDDDYDDYGEGKRKKFRERGVGVALGVDSDEEIEEDSESSEDDADDDDLFGDELDNVGDRQRAEVLRLKREKKRMAREERRRERRNKIEAKRKAKLRRAFEPVQLVENFCTERDDEIRMVDSPERFYDWLESKTASSKGREAPLLIGEDLTLDEREQAQWIVGKIPEIQSEFYAISANNLQPPGEDAPIMDDAEILKKETAIVESIVNALRYMRGEKLEPDFIKRYRKDYVTSPAVRENLYRIMDEDAEWERMTEARSKIDGVLADMHADAKMREDSSPKERNDTVSRLREELKAAQEQLDETVKDEERVKVELAGLEKKSGDGAMKEEDDDDDLFGDDDDEDDEAVSPFELTRLTHLFACTSYFDAHIYQTKAAKEKEKDRLQKHLNTLSLLLESQAEKVARLDAAFLDAEAAAEAVAAASSSTSALPEDPNVVVANEKKMCRDKLWHYGDYSEYILTILEYRHVMDMKGYLNLIKEGNDAIKDKSSALGGSLSKNKDKKKRSRRFDWDYYRTCVSEGLRNICYKFVLPPFRAGIKLEDTLTSSSGFLYERTLPGESQGEGDEFGDPKQWIAPKIEGSNPQEFASELIGSGELVLLSTARDDAAWDDNPEMDDPLRGCRYVAAMELAHEPRIRRHLRDIYRSEVVITTRPTAKGLGVIDAFHEYYGLHLLRNKPVRDHFPMDEAELEKKRARLNQEELKELDEELKKNETNSCIQYLNLLKAERSGDITVQVHLPFIDEMSDSDTPWYKKSVESMGRDRQNIGRLMEALERVYFPADGDIDEWNDERRKILKMALVNYLLPQFEAETRRDLRDASIRIGVEAAARNLHTMAMEGPYRPSHMLGENRFVVPTGDLPVVGVCASTDSRDGTFLAAVNSVGELSDHLAIPGGASITGEKMREKVITFLMQARPSAVVVGSGGGVGTRLTVRRLNEVIVQATERWNNRLIQGQDEDDEDFEARMQTFRMMHPGIDDEDEDVWKCSIDIVDDNVAQLFGRSVRGKKEFPDAPVNLKIAVATARWAKDPLCELAYTWSTASDAGVFGTEMLFMNVHPLQRLLPKSLLLRQYERVLCNVTAEVGVDINAACTHDHMHGLLTFIPGLGPRKASNLKQSIARIGGVLSSRKSLLAKRLLGPIVYNNSAAFLRVRETEQLQDQMLHPLDDTRCHPDVYLRNNWAIKIAVDALELGETSNSNEEYNISAIRDVMQNSRDEIERLYNATKNEWERQYGATFTVGVWDPREAVPADQWRDKVEELDLDTFADMILNMGNGKWLSHLTMIKWEFRLPFEDPRKPMEPPSGEKLFKLLTGESDVSLCPGKEVTGKVVKNGDFGSQVKLEGEIPGFIPLRNLSDDHVESAEDIVSVGTIVTAIVTEVKMDHVCVDLTLKMEDFKKKSSDWGRPASLPPLDACFDRAAALKIDEEKDKEREARLQALRLTVTTKLGADPNAAEKAALRSGKVTRRACAHPAFRNASHSEVDKELKEAGDAMVGEALIRPSNKSVDSLAIHWVVRPGCVKVIEVLEEDKDTEASIGNRLMIKVRHKIC